MRVVRDGEVTTFADTDLVPGDVLLLEAGHMICLTLPLVVLLAIEIEKGLVRSGRLYLS